LVLASAACGANDDQGATAEPVTTTVPASTTSTAVVTTTTESTKSAFLAAGNAVCKKAMEDEKALDASYPDGPQTDAEWDAYMDDLQALVDTTVRDLRALPQPPGDEAHLEALYTTVEAGPGIFYDAMMAAVEGDPAAEELLNEAEGFGDQLNADFIAYGLTECGK
jgi:hypothetical protein